MAREDDAILSIAKRMTLVTTDQKKQLLEQSRMHFAEMRSILAQGWGRSRKKAAAIELLEHELAVLSALPSTNNFEKDWRGKQCSVCENAITNLEHYPDMLYCPKCLELISKGRDAVAQAFGLWCI